ncbi:MAG: sulfatase-like hydrolase/transferase [Ruthenibacterium sp.]
MTQNILLIVTDQLTWRALPTYGNTFAHTPNIDRIAQNSVKFDTCYTACPLCQPARAALWTSKYPHDIDVLSNGRNLPVSRVAQNVATLGETFANAGYETVHFGKTHDAGALRGFAVAAEEEIEVKAKNLGIPLNFDTFNDRDATEKSVAYLTNRNKEKPFLMVADLVNPHNICGWVGAFADDIENPWLCENLPPLPDNFTVDDMETRPKAVQYICCSHVRQAQTAKWTPTKFRQYLAAYYAYLAMADAEIGRILDALAASGEAENTTVVFFADHGDSMAARARVTKQVDFYEEVSRVPMLFSGAGVTPRKEALAGLTSLLDLFPTLCGFAGLAVPKGVRGVDLSAALRGGDLPQRAYVASEWHTEWGFTISPGRMIRTPNYKYMRYLENNDIELYDLQNDPLEKTNLGYKPAYRAICQQMEALLQTHLRETQDDFERLTVLADAHWRSHTPGYQNHKGIAAPQEK